MHTIRPHRLALVREGDRFIASYPRSGNTWVRYLVQAAAVFEHEGRHADVRTNALIPDIHVEQHELGMPDARKYLGEANIIKSHNIDQLAPFRTIYLFRTPADVLTSHYFHHLRFEDHRSRVAEQGIDAFCLAHIDDWIAHIATVVEQERAPGADLLLVPYERLHESPEPTLRKILDFLGVEVHDESVRASVEKNQFDRLQRTEKKRLERNPRPQPFFRKGIVGDSANHLAPETLRELERRSGIVYEQAFAKAILSLL